MEKQKKSTNRRSNAKYPALKKQFNLSSRRDYIEPNYINGVKDSEGNLVIRPLTDEEKSFLNQFYEETVITNFLHDSDLRQLNSQKKSIIEDETVKELKKEVKLLQEEPEENKLRIKELKEIIKITKKQNEEMYCDELFEIEQELQEMREEKLLYPDKEDHKVFYNENNCRNNCLYTRINSLKKLVFFEPEEYDYFVSKKLQGLDNEHIVIHEFEESSKRKETEEPKKLPKTSLKKL